MSLVMKMLPTEHVCECCGQPNGRCPNCGSHHMPGPDIDYCENCWPGRIGALLEASYRETAIEDEQ